VVLESADGTFCGVASMDTGWNKLEIDALVAHVLLEDGGSFVVEAIQNGTEPGSDEDSDCFLVGR
jgi:hypothetical protein